MKTCNTCNKEKELTEFYGHKNICKICYNEKRKEKCEQHGKRKDKCKECKEQKEKEKIEREKMEKNENNKLKICSNCNIKKKITEFYKNHRRCKECYNESRKCKHGIFIESCQECLSIKNEKCEEHNELKSKCKLCNSTKICNTCSIEKNNEEFRDNRNDCKKCEQDKKKCEHGIRKEYCEECKDGGSAMCEHGRLSRCTICPNGGSALCTHHKEKDTCRECSPESNRFCKPHNKLKQNCIDCNGSSVCIHDKQIYFCYECSPNSNAFCKGQDGECSIMVSNKKYRGYCSRCFFYIFPDEPITRNYKTKENTVYKYIKEEFPDYNVINDRKVKDGTSYKRPDIRFKLDNQVIIIEVDENQHKSYDCTCENKRLMELSLDYKHKKIVFIRFNPDSYKDQYNNNIPSCWKIKRENGLIEINVKKNWNNRLKVLKEKIQYWIENETDKMLEVIQLFYDMN